MPTNKMKILGEGQSILIATNDESEASVIGPRDLLTQISNTISSIVVPRDTQCSEEAQHKEKRSEFDQIVKK